MRLHILGICGTFMSGIAMLAKQCGHTVTGSDVNAYPPMSTQLQEQGITITEGYLPHVAPDVECVIVGNVITRGNPTMEYILANQIPYCSGPAWLAENVLKNRWVLGVAGTHGKTTTASMLAWILDVAGLNPGFLIGGVPENFAISARLGHDPYFVIEADEYDSAFFDKRAKFIHYHPKTLILNNLEFDHADIFTDLVAIKQQFHHLVRTIPNNGLIIRHAADEHLTSVLQMGCWTPVASFAGTEGAWTAQLLNRDGSAFKVFCATQEVGEVHWGLLGHHNVDNALGAIMAANHVGVSADQAIAALNSFKNVKRRLEVKSTANNIYVYDDFAHHPTAIQSTLTGLRAKIGCDARMIAIVEFGSYTMRAGVHKDRLQEALRDADMVVCTDPQQDWGLKSLLEQFKQPTALCASVDALVSTLVPQLQAGDHIVIMSNSGFGGLQQKLLNAISDMGVHFSETPA